MRFYKLCMIIILNISLLNVAMEGRENLIGPSAPKRKLEDKRSDLQQDKKKNTNVSDLKIEKLDKRKRICQ